MLVRNVYLNNKVKQLTIFDGYKNFNILNQDLLKYGQSLDSYFVIKFCNMLYAFLYNDWNEIIVGQDLLYYINIDSHMCKRKRKENGFDWPYTIEDRVVPKTSLYGVANDLISIDSLVAIYYYQDDAWHQVSPKNETIDFMSILNEFGKQFYRDFYFSRIEVPMYLKPYFDSEFLEHLDKFFVNGAFEINPFTWRATKDNTQNTLYCSFYDTITKKPLCEIGGKYYKL